jgi:hypothetical protein
MLERETVDILTGGGWPTWIGWVHPIGEAASAGQTESGCPLRWRPVFRDVTDPDFLEQVRASDSVGVIAADTPLTARALADMPRRPTVLIEPSGNADGAAVVTHDNVAIGRLAAEHLHERGCDAFAFFGIGQPWSRQRLHGFSTTLERLHIPPRRRLLQTLSVAAITSLSVEDVERLPGNVGIFGAAD